MCKFIVSTTGNAWPHQVLRGIATLAACLLLPALAGADVTMRGMFTDHMVLQRDISVPIWGLAAPDEKVTVKFAGQEKTAAAGKDGKWMVRLDPLKAGGPDTLTITGKNTVTLTDVLVGEVWVGSGQSNMALSVEQFAPGDPLLAQWARGSYPRLRLMFGQRWVEANDTVIPKFSALLFSFGVSLQKELDVPVGLMVGASAGTPSGRWVSPDALAADGPCNEAAKKPAASADYDARLKKYQDDQAKRNSAEANPPPASGPARAPRVLPPPIKPGEWSSAGDLYFANIRPLIPYAVRGVLWDQGEGGTDVAGLDQYTLMGALIHGWRKDWGQGDFPFLYVQKPSGGGCALDPNDPVTSKADAFAPLPAAIPPVAEGLYRETYIHIMQYPNTFMVTCTDLGSGGHPTSKSAYGARATRVALGGVYGRPVEIYGPVYKSHTITGDKIHIEFTHVGGGLGIAQSDKLQGFEIAGEDRVFYWATAAISGPAVIVSSDKVPKPVAVRYAWSSRMAWANLFNKDGLPALTFRTDSW